VVRAIEVPAAPVHREATFRRLGHVSVIVTQNTPQRGGENDR